MMRRFVLIFFSFLLVQVSKKYTVSYPGVLIFLLFRPF
jgi:hypothetical protein